MDNGDDVAALLDDVHLLVSVLDYAEICLSTIVCADGIILIEVLEHAIVLAPEASSAGDKY